MLNDTERSQLLDACRRVPLTSSTYLADDLVQTLLETVVDYQQHTTTVVNAIEHFRAHCWAEIRTLVDLEGLFARYPEDKVGNTDLATYLWGYKLWTRAQQLRDLVAFLRRLGIDDLAGLRKWSETSTFADFEGQVKGLGPVVYQWLTMRLGVETVKPDVHVLRFVSGAIGRRVSEQEAVVGLVAVAGAMRVNANVLDWSIWEWQRSQAL
jgi:hypothetical protein